MMMFSGIFIIGAVLLVLVIGLIIGVAMNKNR